MFRLRPAVHSPRRGETIGGSTGCAPVEPQVPIGDGTLRQNCGSRDPSFCADHPTSEGRPQGSLFVSRGVFESATKSPSAGVGSLSGPGVAYPKGRLQGARPVMLDYESSLLPSRAHLASTVGVGDQVPVDDLGDLALEGPQGFLAALSLVELSLVVGTSGHPRALRGAPSDLGGMGAGVSGGTRRQIASGRSRVDLADNCGGPRCARVHPARSSGVPAACDPRFTRARRRGGPRSLTGECRVGGTSDACRV
jgi:hypothetical protein